MNKDELLFLFLALAIMSQALPAREWLPQDWGGKATEVTWEPQCF
jgi:hypothetical protein